MPITSDEYLKGRVEDQINWYENRSKSNKRWFLILRIVEIVLAGLIPFLVGHIVPGQSKFQVVVGLMGVCIAVISGLLSLNKYQENWIDYRTTAESLKHEKFLFSTQSPPYVSEDSFALLVTRIESLISKENSTWARNIQAKSKEK